MCDKGSHMLEDNYGQGRKKRPPGGTGDNYSPTLSSLSPDSEHSTGHPVNFQTGDQSISMKSDNSMGHPVNFSKETGLQQRDQDRPQSPLFILRSLRSDKSKGYPVNLATDDNISITSDNSMGHPVNFSKKVGSSQQSSQKENEAIRHLSKDVPFIHYNEFTDEIKFHKDYMTKKFKTLSEGPSTNTTPVFLNEIYTELYMTEVESAEVNDEHEVRQIETASRAAEIQNTPISCNDIFRPMSDQDKVVRTVLTLGVAGVGKTVSVQKFILDWAEGKANQDVNIVFPLPFRELNLLKEKRLSLVDLIQNFFSELKNLSSVFNSSEQRVMFILDGLDECRIHLDFQSNLTCCDVTEPAPMDVLLTNLIKGNLLPCALLWITSRPAAAKQIPSEFTNLVTEIRGFSDLQKEVYLRKRFSDEDRATRAIEYLKSSRSLYIMCHIPVFCWISATVLDSMFSKTGSAEIPKTLTQVYIHYLIIQISTKKLKYSEKHSGKDTDDVMIFNLGKLAFQQLEKGNLIFYAEDLRECCIDVTEASVYSGVCTQIFREESALYPVKVFSFVHLSIQEFLAALYVFLCFSNKDRTENNMQLFQSSSRFRGTTLNDLHRTAVDQALKSKNGHLDLFLRFLLGLSRESNQNLLQRLLKHSGAAMETEKTVEYLKSNILDKHPPEQNLNLLHCLNELGDTSMVEDMQKSLISGKLPWPNGTQPSFHQCASLLFLLMTAAEGQYNFYPNRIIKTDNCLMKMLPLIKVSREAWLSECYLTATSCQLLVPVLTQRSSLVRKLDLSGNELGDAGVGTLSDAMKNPKCKVESLWLKDCSLTEVSCDYLASVLSCSSSLMELDLSENRIQDTGVELLSDGLRSKHCMLEVLRLNNCGLTDKSCSHLVSALKLNPSHLRELHLSCNTVREPGEKLLEALKKNPCYQLKIKLQ